MAYDSMKDYMRKLAMWYTRTFKPIMTHDELEPIMATLGFVGQPPAVENGGAWKEYVFAAASSRAGERRPKPRLPYPRVDGLHIYTYRAFIDAVDFYLGMSDFSDLFHIRFVQRILIFYIFNLLLLFRLLLFHM